MDERRAPTGIEGRREQRTAIQGTVSIEFEAGSIVGPGQNISPQGIFFTAEASLPVTVRIAGNSQAVRGEVVRFERIGDGRIGIAVRFLDPLPGAGS